MRFLPNEPLARRASENAKGRRGAGEKGGPSATGDFYQTKPTGSLCPSCLCGSSEIAKRSHRCREVKVLQPSKIRNEAILSSSVFNLCLIRGWKITKRTHSGMFPVSSIRLNADRPSSRPNCALVRGGKLNRRGAEMWGRELPSALLCLCAHSGPGRALTNNA